MNTTTTSQNPTNDKSFAGVCLAYSQKLAAQIERAKNNITAEFRDTFQAHEQLLQLAIGEADALAWQTDYPHLIFPLLATEKIQSAAQWQTRQQSLLRETSPEALAA
ncbi:MAG TPA: hypothetical protein VGI03_10920 [Verrucomicrobiae bacterium]|jgi:hypothetical protein